MDRTLRWFEMGIGEQILGRMENNRDALLEIWKTQNFIELPPLE